MEVVEVRRHEIGGSAPATLVLPGEWRTTHFDSDPVREARSLAATWSAAIGDANVLDQFTRGLAATLRSARDSGATFAGMLAGDGGAPIALSLVAAPLDDAVLTPGLIELQWTVAGRRPRRHSLPVGPAVVSSGVTPVVLDARAAATAWQLHVAITHPVRSGVLLTFSSPLTPVAEQLEDVSLTIAATLRWTVGRGR